MVLPSLGNLMTPCHEYRIWLGGTPKSSEGTQKGINYLKRMLRWLKYIYVRHGSVLLTSHHGKREKENHQKKLSSLDKTHEHFGQWRRRTLKLERRQTWKRRGWAPYLYPEPSAHHRQITLKIDSRDLAIPTDDHQVSRIVSDLIANSSTTPSEVATIMAMTKSLVWHWIFHWLETK